MRKCIEPDFSRITKRTTLSTGFVIQCVVIQTIKRLKNAIIQRYRKR